MQRVHALTEGVKRKDRKIAELEDLVRDLLAIGPQILSVTHEGHDCLGLPLPVQRLHRRAGKTRDHLTL